MTHTLGRSVSLARLALPHVASMWTPNPQKVNGPPKIDFAPTVGANARHHDTGHKS
jgi:hypothetical protein